MIIDTNVISEMWRQRPDPLVADWLNAQAVSRLYLCTPVLAEIRSGIERMPQGPRRAFLAEMCDRLTAEGYRGRILNFDIPAAMQFGLITAQRERLGRRIAPIDAMIAAIALANGMALVTRNTTDFSDIGLDLVDPFTASN